MSGKVYIVCAPSGAGKTSLVRALLAADLGVRLSVSFTTRAPRPGEAEGRDYHFVSRERFLEMAGRGDFLESAEVHGNLYGTSQAWIAEQRAAGRDILLEIDWQGAAQVRRLIPDTVGIFILPPSFEALAQRLRSRDHDPDEVIALRLTGAKEELAHVAEFHYVIINDVFETAAHDLISVIRAERLKTENQLRRHGAWINTIK